MPGHIDEGVIEQIRSAIDIAALVSDYVTLKRKGASELWGLCPFHNEKTPSFHVVPGRGLYKCFGCGRGGNAFTFLMELEGVSFIEAVRNLAERTGIQIPSSSGKTPNKHFKADRDHAFNALQVAVGFFHSNLIEAVSSSENSDKSQSKIALNYLLKRGISIEIIKQYKLGWIGPGWDGLINHAKRKGINGQVLQSAGLGLKRKNSAGYVDRFRARIIFPILNLSGKPVAFGARRLEGVTPSDDEAKYINSPETIIYKKGEHLYGLFTSRGSIRKSSQAFLVEGYTDLLAMASAGMHNVFASLGTSLTESQARLAARFTSKVFVVYDSDTAGTSAAVRAAEILTYADIEARLIKLPTGKDPDSLLQEQGVDALKQALDNDISFVAFRMETEGYHSSLSQPDQISIIRSLMKTVNSVSDHIRKKMLLKEIAEISGLPETEIERLKSLLPTQNKIDGIERIILNIPRDVVAERDFIRMLIGYPILIEEFLPNFSTQLISHDDLSNIFKEIENSFLSQTKFDAAAIIDHFSDPAIRSFISDAVMVAEEMDEDKARETASGCILAIAKHSVQVRTKELQRKINEANNNNLPTRKLLMELVELRKQTV